MLETNHLQADYKDQAVTPKVKKKSVSRIKVFNRSVDSLLILCACFIIIPFMWIISTSLRLPKDSFSLPPSIIPTSINLQGYKELFTRVPYWDFYLNSIKISVIVVVISILICTMAAYAFARFEFPGRNVLFITMLAGLMIPKQITVIPLFLLISKTGLMDTHTAVILPQIVFPLGIFLIRQTMLSIPKDYEEAAFMDGAGRVRQFISVIVPMSAPAIIVAALLAFIHSWNEFFTPLIFLNSYEKMTLPLGIVALQGQFGTGNLSAILGGVSLSLVAPLLFYIFGQKYLVSGLMDGGIKH